mmetsp:Transcript_13579/g.47302  ORF Transcript_13579/g.47302 Transcript_13579/m.47302 type:complete len:464 (-) Transcript_13579:584-1975(-)
MATRLAARATLRRTVYGAQRTLLREEVRMLDVAQQKAVLGAFDASPFARFDAGWSSVRRDGALPNGNVRRTDSEPRPPRSQAQIDVAAVAAALQDADGDDAEEDDDDDGYDDDEDAAEEDDASDDDDAEDDDGAGPTPEEMDAAVEVGSCGPAVAYDESRGAFEAALGERLDPLLLCDGASARYVLHELLNAGWAEGRAAALVEKLVAVGLAGLRGMEAFKSRAAGEEVRLERLNKDCWGSSYGGLTYSMTAKRLNWLRKAHAQAKSGKSNFESDLFSMLSRYETMTKNGGAGNHAAVPPDVFTMFEQWAKQKAGSAVECFASPLNHRLCDWKSRKRESILFATAFPDVDAPFGGGARFFSAAQTEAAARVDQDVSAQAAQNEAAALEDAAIESTHATADASDAATAADATRQAATASADVAPGETADAPAAAEVSGAPDMSPELARLIRNDVDHRLLVLARF